MKGDFLGLKNFGKKSLNAEKKTESRDVLVFFQHLCCRKTSNKLKKGPFGEQKEFGKSLSMQKKTVKGDPLGFFNIHSFAKHYQIEGEKLWGNLFSLKISHNAEKTERRDPLVSPSIVC